MNISFMLSIHIFTAGLLQALSNGVSVCRIICSRREHNVFANISNQASNTFTDAK